MLDTNYKLQNKAHLQADNLRILLWDIDGTLMRSTRPGSFKEYFKPVMQRIFGTSGSLKELKVSGMTDTQIIYESLKDEGFTPEQIIGARNELLPVFKEEMTKKLGETLTPYEMFPGVCEILDRTAADPNFINCLLTGNFSVAAKVKLSHLDLWKYFENSPNFFGEISHDRRELGRDAVKNVSSFLGKAVDAKQFIVIGDTPNDIAAARAFSAKIVSVATGRNHPKAELLKLNPDCLLENLGNTDEVLEVLKSL
ncbi:MAG: HAD family hydrolase [Pyrinomonadaceae bacterium]